MGKRIVFSQTGERKAAFRKTHHAFSICFAMPSRRAILLTPALRYGVRNRIGRNSIARSGIMRENGTEHMLFIYEAKRGKPRYTVDSCLRLCATKQSYAKRVWVGLVGMVA